MPQPPSRQAQALDCLQRVTEAERALSGAREALKGLVLDVAKEVSKEEPVSVSVNVSVNVTPESATTEHLGSDKRVDFSASTSSYTAHRPAPLADIAEEPALQPIARRDVSASTLTGDKTPLSKDLSLMVKRLAQQEDMQEDDVLKCYTAFMNADSDKSGAVDISELQHMLSEVSESHVDQDDVDKILAKFDRDGDGSLSLEEFLVAYKHTPMVRANYLQADIGALGEEQREEIRCAEMSPEQRVKNVGVPTKHLVAYMRKEIKEAKACKQIPIGVLLFLLWYLAQSYHLHINQLHSIERAIEFDIEENANFAFGEVVPFENHRMGHKTMHDVNSFQDFWSWMSMGLIPLLYNNGDWGISEIYANILGKCTSPRDALQFGIGWNKSWLENVSNNPDLGTSCDDVYRSYLKAPDEFYGNTPTYLFYNSMVGGLRLRQERKETVPCPGADVELVESVHSGKCVPNDGHWFEPEVIQGMHTNEHLLNLHGGETQYFPSGTPRATVFQQLRALENMAWFDPQTSKIEILFVTYNAHQDCLTVTFINFYMNRAGHIFKQIDPVAMWLHPFHGWENYLLDSAYVIMVIIVLWGELKTMAHSIHDVGFFAGLVLYLRPSAAVDYLVVAYSLVLIGFFYWHCMDLDEIGDFLKKGRVDVLGTWPDKQDQADFFTLAHQSARHFFIFQIVLSFYPFALALRYFKAFNAQPRLALVTHTLSNAALDLVHYGVVFFSIFCVYATSAELLFGLNHSDFATFWRSMTSVFRILLGDFDWDQLKQGGRLQANVWFWSFSLLVNLIMMNMLMAIIMDVYAEVKNNLFNSNAETLWSQSYELFDRWQQRRRGKAIRLEVILNQLEPNHMTASPSGKGRMNLLKRLKSSVSGRSAPAHQDDEMITVSDFVRKVQDLSEKQAEHLLISTHLEYEDFDQSKNRSEGRLNHKVKRVNQRLKHVAGSVERLLQMNQMLSDLVLQVGQAGRSRRKLISPMEERQNTTPLMTPASSQPNLDVKVLSSQIEDVLRIGMKELKVDQYEFCKHMEAHLLRVASSQQRPLPPDVGHFQCCAPTLASARRVQDGASDSGASARKPFTKGLLE